MNDSETRRDLKRQMRSRARTWGKALDVLADIDASDEKREDAYADLDVLEVQVKRVYDVLCTFGGPNVWLTIRCDRDGDVEAVTWRGYWGGTVVTREVETGTPEWRYAEYVAETFGDHS